ncbi:hypothetical protein [Massilia sp. CCM 8734]|uniref:hypothetical protein n=1 Tax=Massilia sp. CCM 8734 TaxID=2609283 RepID=UPI00141E04D5|nr:hypothetical protein [Massilia sp. CCM 8734]NHZ98453.1 hypothetical protein [Massilia sp. CCM 8734]
MPYDITCWVEVGTEPMKSASPKVVPASWVAIKELSHINFRPDCFSADVFALAKHADEGMGIFADRGIPGNPSGAVIDFLAAIELETIADGGDLGFMGHTYVTLLELKRIALPSSGQWHMLLQKIAAFQRESGHADSEVRLVLIGDW